MNLSFGQNLEGKWILVKNGDTYTVPKINLFEFKNGKVISSDLDKKVWEHEFEVIESEIFIEKNSFAKYKFINENRFTIFANDKNKSEKNAELDFVRIEKTITELSEAEIEKLSFENKDYDLKIAFNVELQKPEILEITSGMGSRKMSLKKIGETYFIIIFEDKELDSAIPIREITEKYIEIYGFSRKQPYSLIINKI
jgi:hypothetical protein